MRFSQYLREDALNLALPPDVRSAIVNMGGKIYQVGGAVRDEMLGKVSKDLDLLVVGVELNDLAKVLTRFGKTNLVGKAFGIIKFKPEGSDEDIDISIHNIELVDFNKNVVRFVVECSKGTYVSVLGKDIAKKLDTGGYLSALKRTKVGDF